MTFARALSLASSTLALAIHFSAPARAEDDSVMTLDPVAVTARGHAASLSETPGSVGIVTAEEIESSRKDSIADALADIPGVSTTGDSPWGRDISIRGLSGTSVVILIDGKRINTATDLNARLGLINPMDVERVEVLKGPISALYGSGSTGGVVNIITRKGSFSTESGFHGRSAVSGTTNGLGADGAQSVWYNSKDFWVLGSGSFRAHEDQTGGGSESIANSRYKDAQFRAATGVKLGQDVTLEMSALRAQAWDVGIPGGPKTLPTNGKVVFPRTTNTLLDGDVTWDVDGEILKEVVASLYYNRIERRVSVTNTGNAVYGELRPQADHTSIGGGLRTSLEAGRHAVVTGLDAWSWEMKSSRQRIRWTGVSDYDLPTPKARQSSVGVYAEDTIRLTPDWNANLGGRVDQMFTHNDATSATPVYREADHTDTGWNGHGGLTWAMGGGWTQSVLVGTSYRAADILERFKYIALGGGVTLWGNPDLKPETTLFAEWGLNYGSPTLQGDVRLFSNKIYNYITQKSVSATREEMTNIGEARIFGVEFAGRWNVTPAWNVHGDIAAANGKDETKDQPLRTVAPVSGKFGLGYEENGWFAGIDERYAFARNDVVDNARPVGGYMTTHLAAGVLLGEGAKRHKLSLALDNLFDTKYRNYLANARGQDLVEPGFTATLSYAMEF